LLKETEFAVKERLLLIAFVLILATFGGLMARKYLASPEPEAPAVVPQPTAPVATREILLYFATPDGRALAAETREIEDCPDERSCMERVLNALVEGPAGDLVPVLPRQVKLLGLVVEGDLVSADFSRELVAAHPGGSMPELLSVYGLIDTLAVNFPYVRQLRILVAGAPVETLKGHVDLRAPVAADFRLARTTESAAGLPPELQQVPALPPGGGE